MTAAVRLYALCALTLCDALQLAPLPTANRGSIAARSSAARCIPEAHRMAGFGGAAPASKGKKGKSGKKGKAASKPANDVSPKRQWDRFKELVSDGAPRIKVYAQLDESWTEVGDVAVKAPGTGAMAAMFNKRLILEHAVRVKPSLTLRARELKAGFAGADGEPELLTKQEMPADLLCGFEGLPDSSGMYSKVKPTTHGSDPTAIIGSDFTNKA